jgi:fibronectin type 3 domain-containing protein
VTPSALPAPASIGAAAVSYNSIKITWGSVNGASGYQLYRAKSAAGTYSMIATTAYTSYTNSNVELGTMYYYKVRAYRFIGRILIYSPYSAVVSIHTVLAAPASVSVIRISSSMIRVAWGPVSGASKYEVWRSASESGLYTLLKTTGYTYYFDTSVSAKATYYYKIRAYRLVSGRIVYSDFSVISALQTTS